MPEEFSIPELLSRLQVDRQNDAIRMAVESERLCRRHRSEDAIAAANNAVRTAGHNSGVQGVALLYLSAARFATGMPDERQQSRRDCARAIRALAIHRHNRAIAQIIRAKFEIEANGNDKQISAMEHLNAAEITLQALIFDSREHQRLDEKRFYENLLSFVKDKAEELHASLSRLDTTDHKPSPRQNPTSPAPVEQPSAEPVRPDEVPLQQTTRQAASDKLKSKLPLPTRLIWPTSPPTKIELFSIGSDAKLDYVDATQLSVDGQPFTLEPIFPVTGHDKKVRLHAGREYFVYQIEDNLNQRVLVRCQDRPDQAQQIVVVADPARPRIWIDSADSDFLFTDLHILGTERTWTINAGAADVNPHIIGIVEAVMTFIR